VLFDYTTLLISYTHNGDDTHKKIIMHANPFAGPSVSADYLRSDWKDIRET